MKVRLLKKHAEQIDDVDLRGRQVGDVVDLPHRDARLLVAEEWAIPERREQTRPVVHRRRTEDYGTDPSLR
jgi:hypothetical protein